MSNLARVLACEGAWRSPYRGVRRHLPLLERSLAESPPEAARRTPLAASVGIADTGDGQAAVRFALGLARALGAAGALPHVALTAFAQLPTLPSAQRDAFAASGVTVSSHALASAPLASEFALQGAPTLVVGVPALALFDTRLSVLLEADRPQLRWPPGLRGAGDRVDLALSAARPELVRQLAEALRDEGGFLLRGDQGVR